MLSLLFPPRLIATEEFPGSSVGKALVDVPRVIGAWAAVRWASAGAAPAADTTDATASARCRLLQ